MLNAAASRAGKDQGMQLALDMADDWKERVLEELGDWLAACRAAGETVITIEQFRAVAKNHPASFRAWGPLPALACKAGLLAPMNHADGSPVMRAAESVRTHGHFVRCWRIAPLFPAGGAVAETGSVIETQDAQARRQPTGIDGRGEVLHAGTAMDLLAATSDYHRARARTEAN